MATTAKTNICNIALRRVRTDTIDDFDTDTSEQANDCRLFYDIQRRKLLRQFDWNFTKRTRALTLKSTQPDEWTYAYDYPNECLKAQYIIPPESSRNVVTTTGISTPRLQFDRIPFEIINDASDGEKMIVTDYQDAYLAYTYDASDETLFDPLFEDALEWFLAIDLAIPYGGDSGRYYREEAIKGFNGAIQVAFAQAANEQEDGRPRMPREMQARHGPTRYDYFYEGLAYRRY